ncbi:MAG: ribosome biogenesis GTP-binding protein YihA/YsxC [Acidobacteriota bacterium]|nr:ribosome biogenesis GTP-binding protein YihA/YsxC [Acidobacteriota bacterium]
MTQADFIISAVSERDFPRAEIPEIVFAGRSNVGKSSLINRLTGKRNLARTSSTPGKTQSINFYRIENAFFFVDLPGYGYAKAGKAAMSQWKRLIERYFNVRDSIVLTVQLVDSRMPPTDMDLQLAEWLDLLGMPRLVVATKSDKLSNNQKVKQLREISESMNNQDVVMSSVETGAGCREIWSRITAAAADSL